VLHPEEHAELVDADDLVPALDGLVEEAVEADDPRVVHQDVDPAVARRCDRDRGLPLRRVAYVQRLEVRIASGGHDLGGNGRACLECDVEAQHRGALEREQARVRGALTGRGAGHERDLALDAARHQAETSVRSSARLGASRAR
jgi:hypothetical protein